MTCNLLLAVIVAACLLGLTHAFAPPLRAPFGAPSTPFIKREAGGRRRGIRPVPGSPGPLHTAVMQLTAEATKELEKVVQQQLSSVANAEALDRTTELFSNTVANRPWEALFTSLAASDTFRSKAWAREAVKMDDVPALGSFVTDCFTMSDIEKHVEEYPSSYAAQGTLSPDGNGGWFMKRVGTAQAADAPTKFSDLQKSLKEGTCVLNSAGAYISPLAAVSLAVLEAMQLPVGLNLYITAPNMQTSAPPHTDKQDVFVLQAQGAKHWRVYGAPPPPTSGRLTRLPGARALTSSFSRSWASR